MPCMLHPPSNLRIPLVHRLDHATIGLSLPLVEELNESLISMWRASDQQLFESLPTLKKLLILLLSERTNLLLALVHFRHREKLIVELTQQTFQGVIDPSVLESNHALTLS